MEQQSIEMTNTFVSPAERVQLIQYCARYTKNQVIAEDLAQETLLEAWRHQHALRDPQRQRAWIFGIAHNICLRWLRTYGRDAAHMLQSNADQEIFQPELAELLVDDCDIEVALERKELVELLDRALMLLPVETRTALIQRYVEESSLAEIAAQLGTNASAIAMRLQRGKLSLQRILTHEMRQEMSSYLANSTHASWEETPLWCYSCGQRRLLGQRDPKEGKLLLKCPICNQETDDILNRNNHLSVLQGVKGYKRLSARLAVWCDYTYRMGLRDGSIACACGKAAKACITTPAQFPDWLRNQASIRIWLSKPDERVVALLCSHCRSSSITSLESLLLASAPGQQFLQAHPRIRTLPRQALEVAGRPALLTRFESVTGNAQLALISDEETYQLLPGIGGHA